MQTRLQTEFVAAQCIRATVLGIGLAFSRPQRLLGPLNFGGRGVPTVPLILPIPPLAQVLLAGLKEASGKVTAISTTTAKVCFIQKAAERASAACCSVYSFDCFAAM